MAKPGKLAIDLRLAFALVAGPGGWFFHLNAGFAMAEYVCATGRVWPLHGASLLALAITGVGLFLAWQDWNELGRPTRVSGGTREDAERFLTFAAVVAGVAFTVFILAGSAAGLALAPCGP